MTTGSYLARGVQPRWIARMNLASNLFHIGIWDFAGHFFGMLTPHWMRTPAADCSETENGDVITGGASGVLCLIGGVLLLPEASSVQPTRANHYRSDPDPVAAR